MTRGGSARRSAIVLAGGYSKRFGERKALIDLAGRPLIVHVVERVRPLVDEVLVVVSRQEEASLYGPLLRGVRFAVDRLEQRSPLVGLASGLESASGELSIALPCDSPFVSGGVIEFLFSACDGDAAIPRWPDGRIEPLHAVYRRRVALEAALEALDEGKLDLRSMIARLKAVRFVPIKALERFDPELLTFFNINEPSDANRAREIARRLTRFSK